MVKRLVDIDDDALTAAQAALGTETTKATVNESLRRAGEPYRRRAERAVGDLAAIDFDDRADAWR